MRGLGLLEFFGADWHAQIRSGLERATTEQRNVEIEGVVPAAPYESDHRYRLHIAPITGRGRDSRWCVVIRDISKALRDETQAFRSIGVDLQRIGHDLRESVGQQLTGVAMLMQSLSAQLARADSPQAEEAAKITTLLNHSIEDVRSLSRSLSPVGVAPAGLPAALQGLAEHARAVAVIDAKCSIDIAPGRGLDAIEADHLFGIAQEAVTNATRHARATHLWIRLVVGHGRIELEISDDGDGIDDVSSSVGLTRGLALMTHRARAIGATLSVSRRSPVGTSVRCLRVAT
jgi:signal transduction histidine kinase